MIEVLNQKRQLVISSLLLKLSAKNPHDFEGTLNAHQVLLDLTDNEVTFALLLQKDNLSRLIQAACDLTNVNQPYALGALASIIKEYPDNERQLT